MPPKSGKKTTPGSGGKRGGRAARFTPKKATRQEISEGPAKLEEVPVQAEESVKAEELVVEKHVEVESVTKAADTEGNGIVSMNKEDEAKESVQEYERGERLDLEDNEPEYDPEEYGGGDYDEKEIEQEDVREQGEDVEEELEEHVHDEDEGDVVKEEMDDVHEDLEGEEDDERVGEEHTELAEAEEQEHHDVFKERRKRKEFEVFVGGLDKDATEDDLRKVFGEVGEVTEVRLMMNPQTKKNKGFAFLRFATIEQAKRACSDLKNAMINGKQCGVTPSQDSDTLFLGNICKTWTKEALKEKLKQYGVHNVEDLTLVEDSNNEGMNRGFAFLEFSSPSDAMDSYKRLQKRDVVFGVDRPAKVSFADSFVDPGDEIMAQVKTVFVDGLLPSWDEDHVRELLKKYGEIEKIELARNMPSAKRKDFGFISFDTHNAALTCAKSINNAELGEGENKAKVRARLSRPLERGKGKHVPRGGDFRPRYSSSRGFRAPWGRPVPPRGLPVRSTRGIGGRLPPIDRGLKRPIAYRDRRPVMAMPPRGRPVSPYSRSYGRRPPIPSYPKSRLKRDYGRLEELPPRSRADPDYRTRVSSERHESSYRDNYSSRGSGYVDLPPRGTARPSSRRAYIDDGYDQRFERLPPSYREGRSRDYDSLSGSKRPYAVLDDVPPRYAEAPLRQSRARLDYELGGIASPYGDAYSDRLGRSNVGYGSSNRGSMSRDSHGLYSSRQGMDYSGGSYSGSDVGGMYPSSYSSDYMSRGGDIVGSSYASMYSGRSSDGSSYMGGGGRSGSYY